MKKLLLTLHALLLITCTTEMIEDLCPSHKENACHDMSGLSSSSSQAIVYGTPVTYQGETYQTVVIGNQTWFARNLNYNVSGSFCYNNCTTYGRLYDWATAMNLSSSCNSSRCSSQINTPHQGICPSGWHISTIAEWNTLSSYVQSAQGCSSCDAKHLKATSGWNSNGNGEDTYGFAALPGGYSYGNSAVDIGSRGEWWSASERDNSFAYSRKMNYNNVLDEEYNMKITFHSVRCVKDDPAPSSSSVTPSSSSSVDNSQGSYKINNISDYKTVTIGTQVWMAENLNYYVEGSKCYNNNPANCTTYGRLYDWTMAQNSCPDDWHLPTQAEWSTLIKFAGDSTVAGKRLKSTWGFNAFMGTSGNGIDSYEFAALPGGYATTSGSFASANEYGYWWSATENGQEAYHIMMGWTTEYARIFSRNKEQLISVRCLKNATTPSSSSVTPSSSSVATCPSFNAETHFCDSRDGKVYKKTTINGIIWMAENLQYNATGSTCYNNNCATYGRYYSWATAISDGICPAGWRVATRDDWGTLANIPPTSMTVTSGWSTYNGLSANGTNESGFSALPGGFAYPSSGDVANAGYVAYWWARDYEEALFYNIYTSGYTGDNPTTTSLLNIRCVNNSSVYIPPSSSSSVTPSSSSVATSGVFNDPRGGGDYRWVNLNGVIWMADNLRYEHPSGDSKCYGGSSSANCTSYGSYGRLYDWWDANDEACPVGWHLPTVGEWRNLIEFAGGEDYGGDFKAASGWSPYNGTDKYGFTALPGGAYDAGGEEYIDLGEVGYWWTATESDGEDYEAVNINLFGDDDSIYFSDDHKLHQLSVRCVKDNGTIGRLLPKRALKPATVKPAAKSAVKSIRGVGVRGR